MKTQQGFTLVELVIVMAIAAILYSLSAPGLQRLIANNRLSATTNKLSGALALARSEAVKRGATTVICASNSNQTDCTSTATGSEWVDGWLIWADGDQDGLVDSAEILRVNEALRGQIAISATNVSLSFDATGFATTNTPGTIKVCDDRSGNFGRQLQIMPTGTVMLTTEVACP